MGDANAPAIPDALPIDRRTWIRMLALYQATYGWRHFRKTGTSQALGRGVDRAIWAKKRTRHHYHHLVYNTLVAARAGWGRTRRVGRRAVYEAAMLSHRLGLRGRDHTPSR